MKDPRRILLVAAFGVLTCGLYIRFDQHPKVAATLESPIYAVETRGKVLYVVVDSDKAYFGSDGIKLNEVTLFLDQEIRGIKPNLAVVIGTVASRFGDVVAVVDKVRSELNIPTTISPYAIPSGKRHSLTDNHSYTFLGGLEEPNYFPQPTGG